jgi:iron complex transport system substrate-binding protein
MRRALSSLALLIALTLSSALATTYPLTFTDDLGREVTLGAAPTRIVSMAPSHTETVCALGACQLLVGVDTWSNWPATVADLPGLGDAFAPDLEALVALQPDLVLVDEYSGLHEPLAALGIAVYAGTPQTYAETLEFFGLLGSMLNRETEAAVLAGRVEGEIAGVVAVLAGVVEPTVFIELDPTPYSAGPNSFMGTLLTYAGGLNILEVALGDFPQVDPEYVVAADPDYILLTDAPFGVTAADVAARPGWGGLKAVQQGTVLELDANTVDMLSRAGPRLGEAVLELARLLHPGRF